MTGISGRFHRNTQPESTLEFIRELAEIQYFTTTVIYILSECAWKNPLATKELITLGKSYLINKKSSPFKDLILIKFVGERLTRISSKESLEDLIELIEELDTAENYERKGWEDANKALTNAKNAWKNGESGPSFLQLISKFISGEGVLDIDKGEANYIRSQYKFEHKSIDLKKLSELQRVVLVNAIELTNDKISWAFCAE